MNFAALSDPIERGSIRSKRDYYAHLDNTFRVTVEKYVYTRQLSPIIAHQIDPDPTVRSEKLTLQGIEFCCDVEKATETALAGRLDLQVAWFELAAGRSVPRTLANEVIIKCGRTYAARRLEPWQYFSANRYAKRRQQ